MAQINNPLVAVAVPALSRLADSPERYRMAYLKIVEKIAMITMPGVVFMIAMSDWLVLLLLGPQWREAGRIFMLLGVAAVIQPVTKTVPWLFTTQGRSRELLRWGFISSAIAVIRILRRKCGKKSKATGNGLKICRRSSAKPSKKNTAAGKIFLPNKKSTSKNGIAVFGR